MGDRTPDPATPRQMAYVESIRKRLHIGTAMFAAWCRGRYGCDPAGLDKAQASDLIDYLGPYERTPPAFLEEAGQRRLM